jgi:uncharacterized protein YydD (DUF2326 family)
MIISIESTIPTFKSVRFHKGLNVLLADTHPGSTGRQTRNSAGKSSLVEIVHFLLGSDCDKDSLFRTKALIDQSFIGTFVLAGETIHVSRSGNDPSKILVAPDKTTLSGGPPPANSILQSLRTRVDRGTGIEAVSNVNWRRFLGHHMFKLPADPGGTVFELSYTPTFRALFSYFARRWASGAFLHPERQAEKQQRWDWQVNLSYLLGLDWQIPFEFQKVRVRERMLEELKKAAKGGALGDVVGTVAELRPQLTIAETEAAKLRGQLGKFEVLDSYVESSRRAARAKTEMQTLTREIVSLQEKSEHLGRAVDSERRPARSDIERLDASAQIELPQLVLRRFEQVTEFYDSVLENRRTHLQNEIAQTRENISKREQQIAALDAERSAILQMLQGRGALDDFVELQKELASRQAAAASLRERYKAAEALEGETTQLDIDRANLKRRLQEDHKGRKDALNDAILIIANAISELYDDRHGRFVVEATENGPEFRISIDGDRGGGISNMEVFCLDLAMFEIVTRRFGGPGFVIHDSHLFDGVDERQIARALMLGSRATDGEDLQYIVTMNSDIFDRLPLPEAVNRETVVLNTRLSDDEKGGLFGFRFD